MLLAGLSSSFVFFIQKVKSNLLSSIQYGTKRKSMMTKLWPRNSRHKIYIMWGEGCTKKQTKIRKKKKTACVCVCVCVWSVCFKEQNSKRKRKLYRSIHFNYTRRGGINAAARDHRLSELKKVNCYSFTSMTLLIFVVATYTILK